MAATVFFSWQTDTPNDVGRNFVRKALEDACAKLGQDASIAEAHRDLAVDSDTQGVAGQPPVVETIFRKIDAAKIFVADMTFVAKRPDGRPSPNPNVLIEYGWALRSLSYERIICVMNIAHGKPSHETLPFDLQHVRWPMTYDLPEGSTQEVRAGQRKALTNKLTDALRACLGSLAPPPSKRVPLTELREWATAAGWCSDVHSATIGDNDWWTFAVRLRQAAVDGTIKFWGRRYVADFGQALDTEALVEIPKEHFATFEFDPTALAQVDNYDLFTTKLGSSPGEWKGQIFRDLHVDADQAQAWLTAAGAPPPSAEIAVGIKYLGSRIGDYQPVCCLVVTNTSRREFDRCVVEMTELSRATPDGMPMPLTLRTDEQIRNGERGPFAIFAGQQAIVPLAFRSAQRANEWFLFDENGRNYLIPADPTKMLLRVYGGSAPGAAEVFINTDVGWNAMPSVRTVTTDFRLYQAAPAAPPEKDLALHEFFAPELARIFRQQIRTLERITVNFICTSTKQPLPGDSWASLKPPRPVLYPDASQFRELPAKDATLLVAFYDSLQGVTDTIDSYIDQWPTTDVNAWNGLMQQVRNSLILGEKAISVFCAAPASGTMLSQYERVTSGMKKALGAHIARHSAPKTGNQPPQSVARRVPWAR
ncbi:hypothetical protein [Bradyrhizobium sp. S3.3.6]|uniref:hypothetical protein n=1 Tax=Bradyrhizobium sp. S3.3.6 TaxID=3156429 RepID=UPI00339B2D32